MFGDRGVAPVTGAAHVGGDAFAVMEDLDGAIGDARPELLFGQAMGHRVIVLGDLDMIIEAGAALFPFGVLVGFGGVAASAPDGRCLRTTAGATRPDALSDAG